MVTKRFSLLFYLKKARNCQGGNKPVYMRITINSERTELSVDRKFDPKRWNKKAGRATGTKEDAKSLNDYLDSLQVKVHEAHRNLLSTNEELTVTRLKDYLQGRDLEKPRMILEVFAEHNKQLCTLIQKGEYAKGTLTHFNTTYRHTQAFIHKKFGRADVLLEKADLPVTKLDYGFISDFAFFLKSEVCAHNTAMKYLGSFKKIVLICVSRGWLARDPFFGFKMAKRDVEKDFLVEEELELISNRKFCTERLTLVRDIFLFSCYTGLAYADVRKLKRSEIRTGIDGKTWLFIQRQKSSTPSPVPLLPLPLIMLEKYKNHPRCLVSDRVLPILTNQKMNEYLKEIADVCQITKKLTYHTARHTFATTVTLNNDVPIESVSKMLGHKSLKQTQHYAKILNRKVSDDMQVLSKKLARSDSRARPK